MAYSKAKKPSVFEKRCADIVAIYNEFFCDCVSHAKVWNLSKEEAEDLAQETMRKALMAAYYEDKAFDVANDDTELNDKEMNRQELKAYLIGASKRNRSDIYNLRTYCNLIKRRELSTSETEKNSDTPIAHRFYVVERHPLNDFMLKQMNVVVNEVLSQKRVEVQKIWTMDLKGVSYEEIGAVVGIKPSTVGSIISRLKDELQAVLNERGFQYFEYNGNDDIQYSVNAVNDDVEVFKVKKSAKPKKKH
jgi:DNA-directed RNA polymerase specialized sigma24 family protein